MQTAGMQGVQRPGRTIALCAAMQAVGGGLGWSLVPALMPKIAAELELSHTMGGIVWGAAPLGIALASPFGGAAIDRYGPRRVAGVAMLVGALACALRAAVHTGWAFAAVMFLFGLHMGFVAPALPKLLAGHVALHKLGRANGLTLLSYTVGTALVVLTGRTWLEPFFGGWRPLTFAAAGAMTLVGLLWLALAEDRGQLAPHASLKTVLGLVKDRQLVRVGGMHFLLFGGYLAMLGLLPRALAEAGLPPAQVGLAVAGWLGAAAFANFTGPALSDRIGRRRPFFLGGAVVAGISLAVMAVWPPEGRAMWLLVAALGGGSFAPLLLTLPLELPGIGPAKAGGALGLLMLIGQAGGFLLPVASGAAAQAGGFPAALGLLAVAHLAILLPAWTLRETGRAAAEKAAAADALAPANVTV